MTVFSGVVRYCHTIKYLKLIQIYGQFAIRLKKIKINSALPPAQRTPVLSWVESILKSPQLSIPHKLLFLNQERAISANTLWCDPNIDKLWRYNLHYFDVINSVSHIHPEWCSQFIHRWIQENPPADGCGWESYPISLRIVNWIKWILQGNQATEVLLHSLAIQARYLRQRLEIHLLGNHILANAKALLFVGLFFKGQEADNWFKKGFQLFNKELAEQVLPDGGHFELSPMYHSIILEDVLDVINLFKTYGKSVSAEWINRCEKMHVWLHYMCHTEGDISFFNDAALGVAPTLKEIKQYQKRLALKQPAPVNQMLMYFPDSGYCRIQKNNVLLLIDVGNIGAAYQPAHGHADTLSFELSLGHQRLIVNSGTSCYAESAERLCQRSSQAHNVLTVDDQSSSQVWKSFRVAKRARVHDVKIQKVNDKVVVSACHDGYCAVDKIYHTRIWTVTPNVLLLEDKVSGKGFHKVTCHFHLHPQIELIKKNDSVVELYDKQSKKFLAFFEFDQASNIIESAYHPQFNVSVPNKKIVVEVYQCLPILLKTYIKFNG